jgi:hypothetical protein
MAQRTFPQGFFTSVANYTSDTLATAAQWCDENALAAAPRSRSRSLWTARREAIFAVIQARGAYVAKLDAYSPYVVLTKDEYTALVNSPTRAAAGLQ